MTVFYPHDVSDMPRTVRDKRFMQSSAGDRYTVLHFVDIANCDNGNRSLTPRRIDTFQTDTGCPVMMNGAGRFSALVDGRWIDLFDLK